MDAFIIYTLDADNKKTIWKTLYKNWEDALVSIQKSASTRYHIHLNNFMLSDFMKPRFESIRVEDCQTKTEGILYASVMNGAYRYYVMKLDA